MATEMRFSKPRTTDLFSTDNGASFSEDRKFRFSLWRIWDAAKPLVMFIGLNPSTANENTDDATIRRVKSIASNLGYGGVYMMNCFPFISTDPAKLKFGYTNDSQYQNYYTLQDVAEKCQDVIFAWGNFKEVTEDIQEVLITYFPNAKALHINKNGSPKHPLYCKSNSQLINFKNSNKGI